MKLAVKTLLSVTLLATLFFLIPWDQMASAFRRMPPSLWLIVLVGFVLGHWAGSEKWRLFVNLARGNLSKPDAIRCYCAGLFANLCLPSIVGGDILRMGMAAKSTNRPAAALWGGALDRVTDVVALCLLITTGALLMSARNDTWQAKTFLTLTAAAIAVTILVLPLVMRRPLASWPAKLRRPISRSLVAIRHASRRPGIALLGLLLSLSIQSWFVLLNAVLGNAIGISESPAVWLFVWPLAKIASLVPISLGGLAVREASLAALFLPFGVPAALSVVCSLLWQTVLIIGGLIGGLIWLLLQRATPNNSEPSPFAISRPKLIRK